MGYVVPGVQCPACAIQAWVLPQAALGCCRAGSSHFLVARSSVSCSSSLPDPCCTSFLVLLQCFSLAVLLLVEGTAALVGLLHASPALVQCPGTGPQPFLSPTSTEQLTEYFLCLFKTKHKQDPPLSN